MLGSLLSGQFVRPQHGRSGSDIDLLVEFNKVPGFDNYMIWPLMPIMPRQHLCVRVLLELWLDLWC